MIAQPVQHRGHTGDRAPRTGGPLCENTIFEILVAGTDHACAEIQGQKPGKNMGIVKQTLKSPKS